MKDSQIALTTDRKSKEEEKEQAKATLEVIFIYQHLLFTEYFSEQCKNIHVSGNVPKNTDTGTKLIH